MEEDDNDDFLGGVIEFGDGRQYTIQVNDPSKPDAVLRDNAEGYSAVVDIPASKEDRLVDDVDRSWPRSRQEQSVPHAAMLRKLIQRKGMRDPIVLFRNLVQYLSSSTQLTRDHAQLRVPSNERSNRMEHFSGLNRPGFNGQHKSHQVL